MLLYYNYNCRHKVRVLTAAEMWGITMATQNCTFGVEMHT